jgi:signal peptidase I
MSGKGIPADTTNVSFRRPPTTPDDPIGRDWPRRALRIIGATVSALITVAMVATAVAIFVFHIAVQPVLSGSMRPTFDPGAAIITRAIPTRDIRTGDVIVFLPPGETNVYAHRVTSVSGPADHPVITTKGDANPAPDRWHAQIVTSSVPLVIGSIPGFGRFLVAVEQRDPRLILLITAGLVFCLFGARDILGPAPEPQPSATAVTG